MASKNAKGLSGASSGAVGPVAGKKEKEPSKGYNSNY